MQVLGKGLTTLSLMYVVFPCISVRGCFQDLTHDLMVIRQQLYRCARAPLLTHLIINLLNLCSSRM
jgi:hypothetical protein